MSVMEVTTRVTYPYLMNKTKSDLAQWIIQLLNEVERLRALVEAKPSEHE